MSHNIIKEENSDEEENSEGEQNKINNEHYNHTKNIQEGRI
jgi:hypothetical protein